MATIYYTASSLDGFIADPEATLDWLLTRDIDVKGPMGYETFIQGVGALAMGATTYEWLRDREETWPYSFPAWVFTHRDLTPYDGADIRITADDVASAHAAMVEEAAGKDVWIVGGGDLAGQFADHGLLDAVWVQYAPVVLGSGAPLLPRRLELRHEALDRNGDFICARLSLVGRTTGADGYR